MSDYYEQRERNNALTQIIMKTCKIKTAEDLGRIFATRRRKQGLTLQQARRRVGISFGELYGIEKGTLDAPQWMLNEYAKKIGLLIILAGFRIGNDDLSRGMAILGRSTFAVKFYEPAVYLSGLLGWMQHEKIKVSIDNEEDRQARYIKNRPWLCTIVWAIVCAAEYLLFRGTYSLLDDKDAGLGTLFEIIAWMVMGTVLLCGIVFTNQLYQYKLYHDSMYGKLCAYPQVLGNKLKMFILALLPVIFCISSFAFFTGMASPEDGVMYAIFTIIGWFCLLKIIVR